MEYRVHIVSEGKVVGSVPVIADEEAGPAQIASTAAASLSFAIAVSQEEIADFRA